MPTLRSRSWLTILLLFTCALRGLAATATVVILHTNDIHDHVRSGAGTDGGLPWIAGYVAQVRAQRSDVILLDAGDVTEKGDMVAAKTNGVLTYEAMRRMRYDAVTLGNHDFDAEFKDAREYEKALGQAIISVNLRRADGSPAFAPSKVLTVGPLKIGVIGATVPMATGTLSLEETGRALAAEAQRLRPEVHLLIALCHEGSAPCAEWSKMAPMIDVFVSGHSHELLPHPVVVPETGARIVQTGAYARHVGRLDLVVDLETRKIASARDEMVELPHATAPVDREMLAWVLAREQELCPEAGRVVVKSNPERVSNPEIGWLAAEAVRRAAKVDIGFCSAERIVRSPIYPGKVDVNALFMSTGLGRALVVAELSGADVDAYLNQLQARDRVQTNWSGFKASRSSGRWHTNLDPHKTYRVAMSKLEWSSRFSPAMDRAFKSDAIAGDVPSALAAYAATIDAAGETLGQRAKTLVGLAR